MSPTEEVTVGIAAAILRGAAYEIEAASLEAIAEDSSGMTLDAALAEAVQPAQRGGAFGMEIVGTILIPVAVAAAREFWAAYQKRIVEKLGVKAADATIARVKQWFVHAPPAEVQAAGSELALAIRRAGTQQGLASADIEALVAAALSVDLARPGSEEESTS